MVVGSLLILVIRRPDAFLNPQFWAEDFFFLLDAEKMGVSAFVMARGGYLHLLPRAIAWFATYLKDECADLPSHRSFRRLAEPQAAVSASGCWPARCFRECSTAWIRSTGWRWSPLRWWSVLRPRPRVFCRLGARRESIR
jgi:hypothetical protein